MKKLYGAAAKAHAKKVSKLRRRRKRRRNPAARRRRHVRSHRRRRRRRNPAHPTLAAAKATYAPKKRRRRRRRKAAAVTPKRRRRRRRKAAAVAPKRRRRRRSRKHAAAPKRRRRRSRRRSHSRRRRHHARRAAPRRRRRSRRRPGAKRRTGLRSLRRARRSIKYQRRRGGLGAAYIKKHHMRTNPAIVGELMSLVRAALPVAASLYVSRIVANKVGPMIPGVDKLGTMTKPVVALGICVGAHYGTKRGPLTKWRGSIMLGTGLNLIDSLISAFAPADVKSMFGLGDSGLYDKALSEYVTTGEYVEMEGLSDYVTVDGVTEELGAIQEELGVEEDLGDSGGFMGGVPKGMLKALPAMRSTMTVPARSFSREVPAADEAYDNSAVLYAGIFKGGF